MSVDQRRANWRTFEQAEIAGCGFRQARAQRRAGRDNILSDFCVVVRDNIAEADVLEIARTPALFMGEIIPFASDRAHRTCRRSGRAKRKTIREVEEMTCRP